MIIFLGIPYDGSVEVAGCRLGPQKIFDYLNKAMFFNEKAIYKSVNILNYSELLSLKLVEDLFYEEYFKNKNKIVNIGGNHIIALPILKTLCENENNISLIYFDAHSDCDKELFPSNSSFISYLKTKYPYLVATNIGLRFLKETLLEEINCFSTEYIFENETDKVINEILKIHQNTNVYISIDLDVLDPAFAPGVSAPIGTGLLPLHLNKLIKGLLNNLNVIGIDVVEYNPYLDVGAITLSTIHSLLLCIKEYWD